MEPISSVPNQSAETTILTGGGAYISGSVVAETFIGRDQYNYYFIGLAPLVHDPTRRFRNFLNEYLGTPSQSVPFGGRQAQLEELHRWLNDAAAPPYYLMTAEAGRGKSALVCRWMEEVRHKRPEVEVIFIPISIRFETAAQDTVFAALAARLAKFYDDPLKPAALSGAQWQGVCESYLDRTPPAGKQLLIILDGLDEATGWHFGAGFFSTDPPSGLRVVVTARLRVGESTPQGWAATLGWPERLTQMVTLPPLSRTGIEEALTSMGDPLAGFADQATIVEQLYRLTEGDPLLVRLYVQEFEKQKATVGTLDSAALHRMTPGLQGYFDQWWKGQKAQWRAQGNDPEKEEAHLRLLLDALAAALGPLTLDDLAQLHPDLGSSRLIRAQLQSVERWVIGDGKQQGYSYSHPRLGYYFWEQLSDKEQVAWDERFCAWGATTLAALNAEQLDPKAAPVYLLRHYGEHLERSHVPAEAFYALISNGWRRAWEELDISYAGFLDNVEQVYKQAKQNYNANSSTRAKALVQQVRSALCQSSIISLGTFITPEFLAQLIAVGLRTPEHALTIVKLTLDEMQQAELLAAIAPYLSDNLLEEALSIVRMMKHQYSRVIALSKIANYLRKQQRSEVLREALALAYKIPNNRYIVQAQITLMPHLSQSERELIITQALQYMYKIANESEFPKIFSSLIPWLGQKTFKEALILASKAEYESDRAEMMAALVPYLPPNLVEEALNTTRVIKNEYIRAITLAEFGTCLPHNQLESLVKEVLAIANLLEDGYQRIEILAAIIPHLLMPQQPVVIEEILAIVHELKDKYLSAGMVAAVMPYLSAVQQSVVTIEVLEDARKSDNKNIYIEVVSILIEYLPEDQRIQILTEALTYIRRMIQSETTTDKTSRIRTITSHTPQFRMLAPFLSGVLLDEALMIARTIPMKNDYLNVMCLLVHSLPKSRQIPILAEVLTCINPIGDSFFHDMVAWRIFEVLHEALQKKASILDQSDYNVDTLNVQKDITEYQILQRIAVDLYNYKKTLCHEGLMPAAALYLPQDERKTAITKILNVARGLKSKKKQVYILCKLAKYGPKLEREAAFKDALISARSIKDIEDRILVLQELALCLSSNERTEILEETLINILSIPEGYKRAHILCILAPSLTENLFENALAIARNIEDKYWCAMSLCELALHLQKKEQDIIIEEVLDIVHMIDDMNKRVTILKTLISHLSKNEQVKVIEEALIAARLIESKFSRSLILGELASKLPDIEREKVLREALVIAHSIENKRDRTSSLYNLAPYLTKELLDGALAAARTIENEMDRADMLCKLAPLLQEDIHEEALAAAYEIKDARYRVDRAYILGDLAPHLPESECVKVFIEALVTANAIGHVGHRPNTIHYLVSRLTNWTLQQPSQAFLVFSDSLQVFSKRPRPEFLKDLIILIPFILALAGDEAPQAAEGIYHAIQEVCGWWP